jgi:hypothetical protein
MDCVIDGVTLATVVALAELDRDALGDRDVEAPVFDDDEVADTLADLEREGARLLEILVLIVCDAERELLSIRVSDRDELMEDDGSTLPDVVRDTETVTFTDADEVYDGDTDGDGGM